MHSSRMRTARSSSRPGGEVYTRHPPWTRHPPIPGTPRDQAPPGADTPQDQAPPPPPVDRILDTCF